MQTAAGLVTFEEFVKLPDPASGNRRELRRGEVVEVPPAKHRHHRIQIRLRDLLLACSGPDSVISTEFAFRTLPQYEYRIADVVYLSREKFDSIDPEGYCEGAPELVIEIDSPSNTAAEMDEKEALCLANGSAEFWVVYPERRVVRVATADSVKRYKEGDSIPLCLFPGGPALAVSTIFEGF